MEDERFVTNLSIALHLAACLHLQPCFPARTFKTRDAHAAETGKPGSWRDGRAHTFWLNIFHSGGLIFALRRMKRYLSFKLPSHPLLFSTGAEGWELVGRENKETFFMPQSQILQLSNGRNAHVYIPRHAVLWGCLKRRLLPGSDNRMVTTVTLSD